MVRINVFMGLTLLLALFLNSYLQLTSFYILNFLFFCYWLYIIYSLFLTKQSITQAEFEPVQKCAMPVTIETQKSDLVEDGFSGRYVVFFDIDGVLHPRDTESLICKDLLLKLIDAVPDVEFIMCSNWRETIAFDDFNVLLNNPVLSSRFKGCTPVLNGLRSEEILMFCQYFNVINYIVFDDRSDLYHPTFNRLITTDRNTGLLMSDIDEAIKIFTAS